MDSWERVTAFTWRLKVPGGWLYRWHDTCPVFVPVPEVQLGQCAPQSCYDDRSTAKPFDVSSYTRYGGSDF